MKVKYSNVFFSILLSLSIILGVHNISNADNTVDIKKVTANLSFDATNDGLEAGNTVALKTYVTFVPDTDETFTTVSVANINMIINYSGTSDDKGLSYSSFNEDSTFIGCVTQLLDDNHTFKFTWADMAGTGKIVNVNEPILIGTLKFTFDSKMDDGDDVYFGVDVSEDEFEEFVTFFKDDNDNSSKLSSEAVLDYQARNCTHPGKDTDEWTVTKESTCTEKGTKTYTCPNCKKELKEDIQELGHSYLWESINDEQHQQVCERCRTANGATEKHGFKYEVINDEQHKKTCETCSYYKNEDHDYPEEWTIEKEPTCTEKGLKYKECTICGRKIYQDIDATGHACDDGVVTKEATYSEEGIKTYTCKNCGATKTEVIPKLVRVEKNEQISTVFESLQEEQDEDEINDELVEETVNSNKVKTGDESGHVILMLLSMSVLSGMVTMLIRAFLRETERT